MASFTSDHSNSGDKNVPEKARVECADWNEDNSNWCSFILLSYLDGLFSLGNQRPLQLDDLGEVSKQDRCEVLYVKFEKEFTIEMAKPKAKRNLLLVLWRVMGYTKVSISILLFLIGSACQLGPVMILSRLTRFFQGQEDYTEVDLWVMVGLLMAFPVISSIT